MIQTLLEQNDYICTYKTRQRRAYTFHLMMEACALSRIMRACLTVLNLDGAAHIWLESFLEKHYQMMKQSIKKT